MTEKLTREEREEIEREVHEQSRRIVFGERGRRAVNPDRENAGVAGRPRGEARGTVTDRTE